MDNWSSLCRRVSHFKTGEQIAYLPQFQGHTGPEVCLAIYINPTHNSRHLA